MSCLPITVKRVLIIFDIHIIVDGLRGVISCNPGVVREQGIRRPDYTRQARGGILGMQKRPSDEQLVVLGTVDDTITGDVYL